MIFGKKEKNIFRVIFQNLKRINFILIKNTEIINESSEKSINFQLLSQIYAKYLIFTIRILDISISKLHSSFTSKFNAHANRLKNTEVVDDNSEIITNIFEISNVHIITLKLFDLFPQPFTSKFHTRQFAARTMQID